MTYATAYTVDNDTPPPPKRVMGKRPPAAANAAGKKVSLAAKKKRDLEIGAIIETLPLEYRGSQPSQRLAMEKVIGRLMDSPQGLVSECCLYTLHLGGILITVADLVSPPDLPHPRVNKCLIALVVKKVVTKSSVAVSIVIQ